jgi:hypothetical protein
MFYCTLYKVFPNRPKYVHMGVALSYSDRAGAEKFMNSFIEEARALNAKIEQKDNYTYVTGNFVFSSRLGGFAEYIHPITYIIGIETKEDKTLYSLADEAEGDYLYMSNGAIEDGASFERELAKNKEERKAEEEAKKEKAERIINNFKTQLDATDDLKAILSVLIKFSKQKIDKEFLLDTVVAKIQNKSVDTQASTDWYDELSDINN